MKPKYIPGGWMDYVSKAKQILGLQDGEVLKDSEYKVLMRHYINGKDIETALEDF